jgi:hypothetical protein
MELNKLTMDGRLDEAVELAEASIAFAKESGVYWSVTALLAVVAAGYLGKAQRLLAAEPSAKEQPAVLAGALIAHEELSETWRNEAEVRYQQDRSGFASFNLVGRAGMPLLSATVGAVAFADATSAREVVNLPESNIIGPVALSMSRFTGAAALILGDIKSARYHTERAISFCTSLRHRPELALSRLQMAELLLEHYPDERDEATEHLDFAIGEFREMKMQPSLERALRHRGLLKA